MGTMNLLLNQSKVYANLKYACIKAGLDNRVFNKTRKSNIALQRQVLFYVLREKALEYAFIGAMFHLDHSTVIHGVKKIKHLVENKEPTIIDIIKNLNQYISFEITDIEKILNKKGESFLPVSLVSNKYRKFFPGEDLKCFVCGNDEVLEVHHKYPKLGDSAENLLLLCPNCHTKIHRNLIIIKGYNDK